MKNNEKQRHPFTVKGIGPAGKFNVIIPCVSTPKERYPQTPNKIYSAVIAIIAIEKIN